jgi:hypothetical protein
LIVEDQFGHPPKPQEVEPPLIELQPKGAELLDE